VVTHIHLDHAGGAGDVASMFPSASVVVHQKGARHLADPSRLMASARAVYGDALDALFGEMAPVPADRIVALDDVGVVDLGGGRRLDSHYSPGHARHHVGLVDSESGDLYVGDAAGVYIPETGDLRPATPPPDFELDSATTARFPASHRHWNVRQKKYGSGWLRRERPGRRVWISITRWRWCGTGRGTVTSRYGRMATRRWRASSGGSAARPRT
jgi:glyoxylase-like metal-dependent hydrolase (beta-lactamase superfamily II)